jgi:hypothetical protein
MGCTACTTVHFTFTFYSSKLVCNSYVPPLLSVSAGIRFHHPKLLETLTYCWMKNWHHKRNTQQIRAETDLIHVPHYIAGSSRNSDLTTQWHYLQVSFTEYASVYNEGLYLILYRGHTEQPHVSNPFLFPSSHYASLQWTPMFPSSYLFLITQISVVTNTKIPITKMRTQASLLLTFWHRSFTFKF